MSADLRPVQSYINLDAIDAENAQMKKKVKETIDSIIGEFKKAKNYEFKFYTNADQIKEVRKAVQELSRVQDELKKQIVSVNKAKIDQAKIDQQEERAATLRAKRLQAEVDLRSKERREREASQKTMIKESKLAEDLTNDYKQLSKAYNEAALRAKNYVLTLGESNPVAQEAVKEAKELGDVLKKLDASVGQNQRNVGNYKDGFSGLGNSINQITREFPAFTNSVQTGFLALSNNIPIFFDQIKQTNAQIKQLRAEGKETQGLLSQLGSAFFSFGTVLSLGITFVTVYANEIRDFFSSLVAGKRAMDVFAEKQKAINEAFASNDVKEAFENIEKVGSAFRLAKDGVISKKEALAVYNETLGDTIGKAATYEEAEQLYINNTSKYVKAAIARAAAQNLISQAALAAIELAKLERQNITDFGAGFGTGVSTAPGVVSGGGVDFNARRDAQKKAKEEALANKRDELKKLQELIDSFERENAANGGKVAGAPDTAKKSADKIKAINKEFDDSELKRRSDALKEFSTLDEVFYNKRVEARREAAKLDLKIIDETAAVEKQNAKAKLDEVLKDTKASDIEKINARNEYNAEIKKIEQKVANDIIGISDKLGTDLLTIQATNNAKRLEQEREYQALAEELSPANQYKRDTDKIKTQLERRTAFLEEAAAIQLTAIEKNYQKEFEAAKDNPEKLKELDEKTKRERLKIENELMQNKLSAELDFAEQQLSLLKALGFDTVDAEQKIAELRLKIAKGITAGMQDENAKRLEDEKRKQDLIRSLYEETKNVIFSVVEGQFERQKNAVQDEIDALEKRKQKEIEVANASIANEQDRAAAITTINARAQAQKEQLEQRQRKIDQEKARFERVRAIIDVVQNTAIAISKEMARDGSKSFITIPLIAAIGAAQIAAIVARPIPKYKDGTMDHPGGAAIVGDGGKSELVVTPEGRLIQTPSTPTLMSFPKHSIVLPDMNKAGEMLALMAFNRMVPVDMINRTVSRNPNSGLVEEFRELSQTMKDRPVVTPHFKNGEFRQMLRRGQSFTEYLNNNL
ncbi:MULTISPECIES: hypothetical protein [unclassified Paraflavitalea]|uniref:hypothetical protein n=1 Tax=unclassified Paraflavitalea TaxID=2798305 RepID=UPI003D32C8EA